MHLETETEKIHIVSKKLLPLSKILIDYIRLYDIFVAENGEKLLLFISFQVQLAGLATCDSARGQRDQVESRGGKRGF